MRVSKKRRLSSTMFRGRQSMPQVCQTNASKEIRTETSVLQILTPEQCWWRTEKESSDFGTQALLYLQTMFHSVQWESLLMARTILWFNGRTYRWQKWSVHLFLAAAYRYRWQHVLVSGFISLHSKGNPINGRLNQLTTDLEEINQHFSEKNLIPVASFESFDF